MFNENIYRKELEIIKREIGEEIILIPIKHGVGDLQNIFTVNKVGAFIFDAIDGARSVGEICDMLSRECSIARDKIKSDVVEFIKDLENSKMISLVTKSDSTG